MLKEFNPHDPAVLWILEQALKICHKHHIPVSVTGKTTSQFPALLDKLIQWGVTSISVEPNAIHDIRKHIQEAEKARIENTGKN
jgi:pyruvate,water dikinase